MNITSRLRRDGFEIIENLKDAVVYSEITYIEQLEELKEHNWDCEEYQIHPQYGTYSYTILKGGDMLHNINPEWVGYDDCSIEKVYNFFKEYYKEIK